MSSQGLPPTVEPCSDKENGPSDVHPTPGKDALLGNRPPLGVYDTNKTPNMSSFQPVEGSFFKTPLSAKASPNENADDDAGRNWGRLSRLPSFPIYHDESDASDAEKDVSDDEAGGGVVSMNASVAESIHHTEVVEAEQFPSFVVEVQSEQAAVEATSAETDPSDPRFQDATVLKLETFAAVPWVEMGDEAVVGESTTKFLRIENPSLLAEDLTIARAPKDESFQMLLSDEATPFEAVTIPAQSSEFIAIAWTPTAVGRVQVTYQLKWRERHTLQVFVHGTALAEKPKKKKNARTSFSWEIAVPGGNLSSSQISEDADQAKPSGRRNYVLETSAVLEFSPGGFKVEKKKDAPVAFKARKLNRQILAAPTGIPEKSSRPLTQPAPFTFGNERDSEQIYKRPGREDGWMSKLKNKLGVKNPPKAAIDKEMKIRNSPGISKHSAHGSTSIAPKRRAAAPVSRTLKLKKTTAATRPAVKRSVQAAVRAATTAASKAPTVSLLNKSAVENGRSGIRNPHRSRNMLYDERWIEKQEAGFTNWINFTISAYDEQELAMHAGDAGIDSFDRRRKVASVRRRACNLFQSGVMDALVYGIEKDVDSGKLAIRSDIALYDDVGIRENVVELLLSFQPAWLRLGLETLYGEVIPVDGPNDSTTLAMFLVQRVLFDEVVAREHTSAQGFARQPDQRIALHKFALKRIILLIVFLDLAKRDRVFRSNPMLFAIDAPFKSTRELMLHFNKEFVSGGGDLVRYLHLLIPSEVNCAGLLSYKQTPLDEYEFGITNLAVDLRDGVRLCRLVETLTSRRDLAPRMRVPSISRLQKIHNVDVVLDALRDSNVPIDAGIRGGEMNADGIVSGNQQRTLSLLWSMIMHWKVPALIDVAVLQSEIHRIRQDARTGETRDVTLDMDSDLQSSCIGYANDNKLSLLLEWCNTICSRVGVDVRNFTASFSDGKALCLIVNFYAPQLLHFEDIQQTRRDIKESQNEFTDFDEEDEDSYVKGNGWSHTFSMNDRTLIDKAIAGEKLNFELVHEAVSQLGGVPNIIRTTDMVNTIPDEKVVITFVSYLSSRLMDLRFENKAAHVIQMAWFSYLHKKAAQKRNLAAVRLQKMGRAFVARRKYKKQQSAVTTIVAAFRGYHARKEFVAMKKSAQLLQHVARGFLARRAFLQQKNAAVCLQSAVRMWNAQAALHQLRREFSAATALQAFWKQRVQRTEFLQLRRLAVRMQANVRAHQTRSQYVQQKSAAVVVQTHVRSMIARMELRKHRAARSIQTTFRSHSARAEFLRMKNAATSLQSIARGMFARRHAGQMRAARAIQAVFRSFVAHKEYCTLRNAAVVLQSAFRGKCARHQALLERSARTIQASFRQHACRTAFVAQRSAAVAVQTQWRMHHDRCQFVALKNNAIAMQALVRGNIARKQALQERSARMIQAAFRGSMQRVSFKSDVADVIVCQNAVRRLLSMREFQKTKSAVLTMQTAWRQYRAIKEYRTSREAIVSIQRIFRGYLARTAFARDVSRVVKCQSFARMANDRSEFVRMKNAAIAVQTAFRGAVARREFVSMKNAAIAIQSAVRMSFARAEFVQTRDLIVKCQSVVRRHLAASQFHADVEAVITVQSCVRRFVAAQFAGKMRAARTIQSAWRMYVQRSEYTDSYNKVVRAQAFVRGYLARQQYCADVECVVSAQKFVRGFLARKQFSADVHSVVKAQSLVRRFAAVSAYKKAREAIVYAQACVRRHIARAEFVATRQSIVVCQSVARRFLAQRSYTCDRNAIITAQSCVRRFLAMKEYTTTYSRMVLVQACVRRHIASSRFAVMRAAAITIQSGFRMHCARATFTADVLNVVAAQSAVRGFLARRQYQRNYAAVVKAQALVRGFLARRSYVADYDRVVAVQSIVRGFLARRAYANTRKAVITAQSVVRMLQVRFAYKKTLSDIVAVQSAVRRHQAVCAFRAAVSDATKIQSVLRMFIARKQFLNTQQSIVLLQAFSRRVVAQQSFRKMQGAAVVCQAFARRCNARMEFNRLKSAAIRMQALVRCNIAAQQYQSTRQSVIVAQAQVRCFLAASEFQRTRASVVSVQTTVRGFLARRELLKHRSARSIQTAFRMHVARSEFAKARCAAVSIQAQWRSHAASAAFKTQRSAAIVVQAFGRRMLAQRSFHTARAAATSIQSVWRSFVAARQFVQTRRAVISMQSAVRMHQSRSAYLQKKAAATSVQAFARGAMQRAAFTKFRRAVCTLQNSWRCRQAILEARKRRAAILTLQGAARMLMAKKVVAQLLAEQQLMERVESMRQNHAASTIQRAFRSYYTAKLERLYLEDVCRIQAWWRRQSLASRLQELVAAWKVYTANRQAAAVTIQRFSRGMLARKMYATAYAAVVTIQSTFRGHVVRCSDGLRKRKMRRRIEKASAESRANPELRLCNRTSSALEVLLTTKKLTFVMKACSALEVTTRLSRACCERLVSNNVIPILFAFINSCNRSKPHVEMLKHALAILDNLSSHPSTAGAVFEHDETLDVIVEQMQMYRDKEEVFVRALSVLNTLCERPDRAEFVRNSDEIMRRLRSIFSIIRRKMAMEKKARSMSTSGVSKFSSVYKRLVHATSVRLGVLGDVTNTLDQSMMH